MTTSGDQPDGEFDREAGGETHPEPPDEATRRTDAEWARIVANYGERPALDDDVPAEDRDAEQGADGGDGRVDDRGDDGGDDGGDDESAPAAYDTQRAMVPDPESRFVPPAPPPIPWPRGRRAVAWFGVFGVPTLLLVLVLARQSPPPLVEALLLAWFVGGFVYLVATMRRGPRDPWDDGSRV